MKFPSIIRLPRHRTFDFSPRYFDPVKDEIEERTARIRREVAAENRNGTSSGLSGQRFDIKFERKDKVRASASLLQLIIAATLSILVFGWLYIGNDIWYSLFLVLPVYLYFRLRK